MRRRLLLCLARRLDARVEPEAKRWNYYDHGAASAAAWLRAKARPRPQPVAGGTEDAWWTDLWRTR